MPTYNRIYYPLNYVALGREASPSGASPIHGLQSVSLNTSFNLEQFFELGQLEVYDNVENLPSVEMTLEKVLDGYPLIYHLASQGATTKTLANRSAVKSSAVLSIFSDAQDNSSGLPLVQALCSGMYIGSLNYTFPVQGNCTESVTLVGNDKLWKNSGFYFNGHFTTGTDSPASGLQRRQHVVMGAAPTGSVFPTNLPGMTTVSGSGYNLDSGGFGSHVQDITVSTNLGREDLFELGRRRPYYKYANFPVAVDCTINMTPAGFGDAITADSESVSNVSNQPIRIRLLDGTVFYLGTKNKLQSITFNGGQASGGVASVSYSFQNFNILEVTSLSDTEGLI